MIVLSEEQTLLMVVAHSSLQMFSFRPRNLFSSTSVSLRDSPQSFGDVFAFAHSHNPTSKYCLRDGPSDGPDCDTSERDLRETLIEKSKRRSRSRCDGCSVITCHDPQLRRFSFLSRKHEIPTLTYHAGSHLSFAYSWFIVLVAASADLPPQRRSGSAHSSGSGPHT
jgi:hypothetical protein